MGTLFIVSASSGAGKTSIVTEVIKRLKNTYCVERVVTYSSKTARSCEVNGRDYHFVSVAEFQARIAEGFFLETSCAYGTYYGTPRTIVEGLGQGISYILIVDRAGAAAIANQISSVVLIWISVGSLSILEERLYARDRESWPNKTTSFFGKKRG